MTVNDMQHEESIEINAAPAAVYAMVTDLTRMGEWSPENRGGTWLDGDGSSVGDRFEGNNKIGDREWSVVATVTEAAPGRSFQFITGEVSDPLVRWTYRVAASGGGTTLTETWDVEKLPPTLAEAPEKALVSRKQAVIDGMKTTLAAMKATAES